MSREDYNCIEEQVIIEGVSAIRRRKASPARKTRELYLHCPMQFVKMLANARIPAAAWPLALWVIWHHMVSSGGAASITSTFAARAGINSRAARRHAVAALEASRLFQVSRAGTAAVKIALGPPLKNLLAPANSASTFTQDQ